jgi:serine/threonine protein kinase
MEDRRSARPEEVRATLAAYLADLEAAQRDQADKAGANAEDIQALLEEVTALQAELGGQKQVAKEKIEALSDRMSSLFGEVRKEFDAKLDLIHKETLTEKERRQRQDQLQALKRSASELTPTDRVIGQGGFGTVAVGIYHHQRVAVKTVPGRSGARKDESPWHEVESEMLLMKLLAGHPTILQCFGFVLDQKKGEMAVLLELAPYGSLDRLIFAFERFPSFDPAMVLAWLRDMADALAWIHGKRVKHRDVKAQNFLVFEGFVLKLCDFGLAKNHVSYQSSRSSGGGTDGFRAIEVRMGLASEFGSDVFSWAMTAVQLILRKNPGVEDVHGQVTRAARALAGVVGLDRLLLDCVKFDPSLGSVSVYRPKAEEVCRQLSSMLAGCGGDPRLLQSAAARALMQSMRQAAEPLHVDSMDGGGGGSVSPMKTSAAGTSAESGSKGGVDGGEEEEARKPLEALTHEECILLLKHHECHDIEERMREKDIKARGEDLAFSEGIKDLNDVGVDLPKLYLEDLFDTIQEEYKPRGVPVRLLGQKSGGKPSAAAEVTSQQPALPAVEAKKEHE